MSATLERWECPGCGAVLNIASLGIYAKVACPTCGHVDHVHTMLANFRIEGVLGLGGMSVVLRARDLVLDRPLAIKLLNEYYRDQQERIEHFEHECELMAKVRHENVVSVYSAGWEKGQFYIAMELLHGQNLEEMIQEDGMDPAYALEVIRQVCFGLEAAHKAGLLHRDMKPGNIIICDDGHAKVLDFGLSLSNRDENTEEVIWATPFYVPPETLLREAEDLRTDIYALGMTLRHLLTGQDKFDSAAQSVDELLECKRTLPPMAEVLPELDEAYCELVDHMTGYDPASRPGSYASLLVEIDEVLEALSAAGQAGKAAARRKRWAYGLAGTAATMALGAGAAALSAFLVKPAPVQEFVMPDKGLEWHECDSLEHAMKQMQAGEVEQALEVMAELANSEGEPTACAWAALHAALLAELMAGFNADEAGQAYRERLEYHLSRTPASAGQELHAEMASLLQPHAEKKLPTQKLLRAVALLSPIRGYINSCNDAAAQKAMQEGLVALAGAGAAYAPLCEYLAEAQAAMKDSSGERAGRYFQQNFDRALSRLDMGEAARLMELRLKSASNEKEKARAEVRKEALELLAEAVAMLRRRSALPEGVKGVTPESLQALAEEELDDEMLPAELAVLMFVCQGRMEEAASLNPYKKSPDSRTPFAIIMRDWAHRYSTH